MFKTDICTIFVFNEPTGSTKPSKYVKLGKNTKLAQDIYLTKYKKANFSMSQNMGFIMMKCIEKQKAHNK